MTIYQPKTDEGMTEVLAAIAQEVQDTGAARYLYIIQDNLIYDCRDTGIQVTHSDSFNVHNNTIVNTGGQKHVTPL